MTVQPQPLRGFDEECRQYLTEQYEGRGIDLHPESTPEKIEKHDDGTLTIHLKKKSGESYTIGGLDQVLMATGRKPNTAKLGLKEASPSIDTTQHMHFATGTSFLDCLETSICFVNAIKRDSLS